MRRRGGVQTAEQRVFNYDSQIEPYVMMNPDYDNNATSAASGSRQQFIGYIPDLLQELSYIIQFDYDIQPVQDASFGHRRLDGTWDGMVGQLIDRVSRQFRCSALTTRYVHRVITYLPPPLSKKVMKLLIFCVSFPQQDL